MGIFLPQNLTKPHAARALAPLVIRFTRGIFLSLFLLAACSCFGNQLASARVRTSLDVLAQVIDPAYSVAMDSCIASQEVVTAQAELGVSTAAQASALIAQVRARCDQVREGFEAIRLHHDQARRYVESGELERADKLLEQIRADWLGLKGGAS